MRYLLFLVLTSFLVTCATDPGSTSSTTGAAICTYDNCDFDVVINSTGTTRAGADLIVGVIAFVNLGGVRVLASSAESDLLIQYVNITFSITGCNTTPTLLTSQTYTNPVSLLNSYSLSCGTNVSAIATVTLTKNGVSRTINGSGSSGGGGSSLTHHTAFVTSSTVNGNMGGLAGADSFCASQAASGSVTSSLGGTWRAILSDNSNSASSRLNLSNIPIKNTNGDTVVSLSSELWGGSLLNTIRYNQNGGVLHTTIYSGTTSTGAIDTATCNGWTSSSSFDVGDQGSSSGGGATWIDETFNIGDCSDPLSIYCINAND